MAVVEWLYRGEILSKRPGNLPYSARSRADADEIWIYLARSSGSGRVQGRHPIRCSPVNSPSLPVLSCLPRLTTTGRASRSRWSPLRRHVGMWSINVMSWAAGTPILFAWLPLCCRRATDTECPSAWTRHQRSALRYTGAALGRALGIVLGSVGWRSSEAALGPAHAYNDECAHVFFDPRQAPAQPSVIVIVLVLVLILVPVSVLVSVIVIVHCPSFLLASSASGLRGDERTGTAGAVCSDGPWRLRQQPAALTVAACSVHVYGEQ